MAALDDLFSAESPTRPVSQRAATPLSPSATPGPSRRRGGEALFLDGASTPSRTPLKRRYNDFDDEEPPLSPSAELDFDDDMDLGRALDRHDARAATPSSRPGGGEDVDVSSIEPRALAELFDDTLAVQDPFALGGSTEEPVKQRRVMAKVDTERLLGEKGFPALMGVAKKFKSKGKGHETSDLRRLMDSYQMWAHTMFPKGEFAYTVDRVEVVCRTTRMVSAIKGLRDDFYPPPPRSPSPDRGSDSAAGSRAGSAGPNRALGGEESLDAFIEHDVETQEGETYRYAPGAETLAADRHGPRRGGLFGEAPDMPDEDELAAMEEMEESVVMESAAKEAAAPPRATKVVDFGDEAPVFDEEEEW